MESKTKNNTDKTLRRESLRLTENALVVLKNRYLKRDEQGQTSETPEELFDRVARSVAAVEKKFDADDPVVKEWETRFYNLMASLRFLPNSPTLMNAGRSMGMLSACFVLPIPDSIDGIFDAVKHTALIQKAGGGTGFSFDRLRPTGDYIASSGGKTSGPVSFWKVLSETTNAIQQGAFRRGANMGMMSLSHPDILKFLYAKQDLDAFTNYNISVKFANQWMDQFQSDPDSLHLVQNPRTHKQYYLPRTLDIWKYQINDLIEVRFDENKKCIPPENPHLLWTKNQLWQIIVEHAHRTGEPGLAFIDRINQDNTTPHLGRIEAVNPCGEQPLLPFEACNLGSINLAAFVRSAVTEEGTLIAHAADLEPLAFIDFAQLRNTIHQAVRFLDNVIEINDYQIEPIDSICRKNRKIGLGVMGFADALYKLAVPYDCDLGCNVGRELMRFLNNEAHLAGEHLARRRGNFPAWNGSRWQTEFKRPQRNAAVTTVAPTGTLSILADCSGGIEPLFSLVFTRNVLGGKQLLEVNPVFRQIAQSQGFYTDDLIQRIAEAGSLASLDDIPDDIKRVFVCTHDIAPEWHVRMQAAFQDHCDAAISKTINFPTDATVDQIDQIYRLAYKLKCKGITVYRDASRDHQPMTRSSGPIISYKTNTYSNFTKQTQFDLDDSGLPVTPLKPISLPEIMTCIRVRQMTPFGNMHVKITVDPHTERELEVFAQLGKGGDVANSDLEAICRLLSLMLRCGCSLDLAIKQLDGIGSSLTIPAREGRIMSLGDGLAKALQKYLQAKQIKGLKSLVLGEVDLFSVQNHSKITENSRELKGDAFSEVKSTSDNKSNHVQGGRSIKEYKIKCPACGGLLSFEQGCVNCHNCGYSQC